MAIFQLFKLPLALKKKTIYEKNISRIAFPIYFGMPHCHLYTCLGGWGIPVSVQGNIYGFLAEDEHKQKQFLLIL